MAVTSAQIVDFLLANPGMTDAQIVAAMEQYGVSPAQMATAVGLDEGAVAARVGAAIPANQAVLLGDTYVQAVNQVTGSGENQQVGGLENVITYKASDNKVGGDIKYYSPTGEYQQTTQQQKVDTSLGGAIKDIVSNPGFKIIAATYGLDAALSAFGATGATFAGEALADAGLLSGVGSLTAGLTAAQIAALTAQDLAIGGGALAGTAPLTAAQIAALTAQDLAIGGAPTSTGLLSSTLPAATATIPAAAATIPAATAATTAATALTPTATNIATSLLPAAVKGLLTPANVSNLISGGLTTAGSLLQQQASKEAAQAAQQRIDAETAAAKQFAAFRPVGMTTRFGKSQFGYDPVTGQMTSAGYTLDPQAKNAQDRLVKLAEQGLQQAESAQAQFKPALRGAESLATLGQGYLDAQTDPRLAQIASQYLAQSPESKMLTSLGGKYIAQSPQEVAQNYLKQQMDLLQPGRETELANLQTKLRNQGRMGLSVSQGGNLGATTPELQALYNARAQQEAVLAANAQQAGQQQVQFGAGLVGTGQQLGMQGQQFGMNTLAAQQALEQQRIGFGSGLFNQAAGLMGQYYAGQQAAYAPYNTAMGQVQNLEILGQQPFNMSAALGQQTSLSGARTGQLGLTGAQLSTNLATSANATANPYAQTLMAAGNPNAMFGQSLNNVFSGLFGNTPQGSLTTGFTPNSIQAGEYGLPVDPNFSGPLYY